MVYKKYFYYHAFGNTQDTGELYSLRYFDSSESSDFELSETLLFSPDAVYGSVFDPVVISSSLAVNINLPAGSWTWFSVDALIK